MRDQGVTLTRPLSQQPATLRVGDIEVYNCQSLRLETRLQSILPCKAVSRIQHGVSLVFVIVKSWKRKMPGGGIDNLKTCQG